MLRRLLVCLLFSGAAHGETLRIAVAANFAAPLQQLIERWQHTNDHELVAIPGSTGALYAQIRAGAPYHVFLAADSERPRLLEASGHAAAGSRVTYAVGRLALWSKRHEIDDTRTLFEPFVQRIAIANPDLAPFGLAAKQVIAHIDADHQLNNKLVYGQNIAQVHALTATGSVDAGFVALSSVVQETGYTMIPADLHDPIRQDAVLTTYGAESAAAAFLKFLTSEEAQSLIRAMGYATADAPRRIP